MTPNEIAQKAAEEVFRTIERERTLIKANVAEAIERVLLTHQVTPVAYVPVAGTTTVSTIPVSTGGTWWPASGSIALTSGTCGND